MSEGPSDEPRDHLDTSPSETVRRHAATFRSVRVRLAARESRAELEAKGSGEGASGDGRSDGASAQSSDGDGLRVVGAGSAAKVAEVAASNGWRVTVRIGQARRERDGAWFDSAVVVAHRGDRYPEHEWALGHWRADPVVPPMKRKWKFTGATVWTRAEGVRTVGARELSHKISSPISDALECEQTQHEGGEGSHGEGRG